MAAAPALPPKKAPDATPPAKAADPKLPTPAPESKSVAVEEARTLRAAGRLDEALQVLRTANREIKQADGEMSPRLVPVNNLAADILVDQEQLPAAEALVEKTTALHESLLKAGKISKESLGGTLLVTARIEAAAKRFLAAIEKATQALPLLDKLEGPRSEDVARGSEILEMAVENLERLLGPTDTMTSDARSKAADVFESIGQLDRAIAQRKGILASVSARAGQAEIDDAAVRLGRLMGIAGRSAEAVGILESDSGTSAARLRLLGELQLSSNQLLAADASFEEAMRLETASSKPSPNVVAADRLRRLLVAVRRGRVNALPDWFAKTLDPLGKASPAETATAINGIIAGSEILVTLGNPAAAISPLSSAASMLKKQLGGNKAKAKARPKKGAPVVAEVVQPVSSGPIAEVTARLAAAHLAVGSAAEAQKIAEPELGAAAVTLGPGDGRVNLLRAMAAGGASGQGNHEAAMALASQALAYGLPRPDDAWEENLTAVYDRLAASDAHKDWRGDFIAGRVRQFGEGHPHVATAWSLFGSARLAAGDWPAAIEFFSKALSLQRTTLGESHPDVAASVALLAHAQRASGDPAKAAQTAADAVNMLEQSVGLNHPATLEAIDVLVAARLQAGVKDGVADLLRRLCGAETMAHPIRRAYHLTRLAEVTATKDKATSRTRLQEAMALPCWKSDYSLTPSQRQQLADIAAYAARVYRMIGDDAAGKTTLLTARSIALRLDESGSLLPRIERLATPEP